MVTRKANDGERKGIFRGEVLLSGSESERVGGLRAGACAGAGCKAVTVQRVDHEMCAKGGKEGQFRTTILPPKHECRNGIVQLAAGLWKATLEP